MNSTLLETDEFENMKKLISVYQEYIQLLQDELNEVVPLAYNHGWRSAREYKGIALREDIKKLENDLTEILC